MRTKTHSIICILFLFLTPALARPSIGIFSRSMDESIPLKAIEFNIHVLDGLMSVDITQVYHNSHPDAIDALYVFPINYQMATTNLTVHYSSDNSVLVSKLMPKAASREIYESIRDRGHGAAYMGFDNRQQDMLSLDLGNIPPNETVKVKVTFVEQLNVEDLSWAIRIPTTFTPPYAGSGVSSRSATTPTTDSAPYSMKLNLEIDSSSPITRLVSTSHEMDSKFAFNNKKAWVRLKNEYDTPDRDIVILYRNSLIQTPQVLLQKHNEYNTYAMLLSFLPFAGSNLNTGIDTDRNAKYYDPTKYLEARSEFVFLIDCSGSMYGRVGQAREAAKLFVKSLPQDSYFTFAFFGSTYRIAPPGSSVKYSKETADAAWEYLSAVDANMGGTELYQALDHILTLPKTEGYIRNVLLMTDGEVTNPDEVIQLVREKAGATGTFVHTIGIGSGASRHLVQGVANAGKGAYYFITEGEAIAPKVVDALSNMCADRLQDVKITWPVDPVVVYVLTTGFHGKPLVAAAILSEKPKGKLVVSGYKSSNGEYFEESFEVETIGTKEGKEAYQLAVKLALNNEYVKDRKRMEELSMKYAVLSKETAFVATKFYANQTDRSKVQEVQIPVVTVRESREVYGYTGSVGKRAPYYSNAVPTYKRQKATVAAAEDESEPEFALLDSVEERAMPVPKNKDTDLMEILNLQGPDGSFASTSALIMEYFNKSLEEIKEEMKGNTSLYSNEKALSTVLMLYLLDQKYSRAPEVALVRMKAVAWLDKAGVKYDLVKKEVDLLTKKVDL